MKQKLAFVHTVPSLVGLFNELSKELLPDVEVFHIADEMLLKVVLAQGGLSPFIFQRVAEHVVAAERAGASVVQCTCSSISPCVDASRPFVGVPVLKIDEPMVNAALGVGTRIGIAATAPTTLKPTTDLVHSRAAALGVSVEVESVLCEGAYDALFSGDPEKHDRIVSQVLRGPHEAQRRHYPGTGLDGTCSAVHPDRGAIRADPREPAAGDGTRARAAGGGMTAAQAI